MTRVFLVDDHAVLRHGLRTLRDQVALLGGTVDLGSSPDFGTYVRLRFPLSITSVPPAA